RMMRGIPALLLFVPLEHRKIDHPEKLEVLRVEQLMPVRVFLCGVQAKLAAGQQDRFLRTLALELPGPSGQQDEVFGTGVTTFSIVRNLLRKIALQALEVIEHAQAALLAERLQFVALLAADPRGLGDHDGYQRQAFRREVLTRE